MHLQPDDRAVGASKVQPSGFAERSRTILHDAADT